MSSFGVHPEKEIEMEAKGLHEIKEGKASILVNDENVFYNKAQVVNRDISIAVLKTFIKKRNEELKRNEKHMRHRAMKRLGSKANGNTTDDQKKTSTTSTTEREAPGLRILEAMSASGLRAIRYAMELPSVQEVVANDIDPIAVNTIEENIRQNDGCINTVIPKKGDARIEMILNPKSYDAIDIDPYGTPVQLLDTAVQAVVDGGMLLVTATDMAVMCGCSTEVCWSKYGSYPIKGKHCHEMALRILLCCIESHANRYKRYIVPVLSMSVDFYIRVYVRVFTSAEKVKESALKQSYFFQCTGCTAFHFQPVARLKEERANGFKKFGCGIGPVVGQTCEHCGGRFQMAGPIWSDPIHDSEWLDDMLISMRKEKKNFGVYNKVHGLLTTIREELPDAPLSICLHKITQILKCHPPKADYVRSALANAGYNVSSTHDNPLAVKTNAPWNVVWDVFRHWVKNRPSQKPDEGSPGGNILAKPQTVTIDTSRKHKAISQAKMDRVPRFMPNPQKNWGPMNRPGKKIGDSKRKPGASQEDEEAPNKKQHCDVDHKP